MFGMKLLDKLKIDDVVGAIPAHLFAGIWGTLIVPFTNGDTSYGTQIIGILAIWNIYCNWFYYSLVHT